MSKLPDISPQKITEERTFRTVVPLHRSLAKGTLMDILRQCGIERADFLRALKKY
jgi:hypothetical protein